jgi:hypothetical protein
MKPQETDYASPYASYVSLVPEDDVLAAMAHQSSETQKLLGSIDDAQGAFRYAESKWSVKEVLGHLVDAERIMGYRALAIARGESNSLPGFDENAYVQNASFDTWRIGDLAESYALGRRTNLVFFSNLPEEAWDRRGLANDHPVTVRALAYIIVGHERHHVAVLKERYGLERGSDGAYAVAPRVLERNLFVVFLHLGRGRARAAGRPAGLAVAAAGTAVVALLVEHLHLTGDDFRPILLLTALFVVPTLRADRAFDVDELSLLQILATDLAETIPGDDVVPLGAFLLLTVAIGESLVGGDCEFDDGLACGCGPDLRILAEAADQNDFIDHGFNSPCRVSISFGRMLDERGGRLPRFSVGSPDSNR